MATIPASEIVSVIPGVLNAGGNALVLNGLILTESTRVPIGVVDSFPDEPAVAALFGAGSPEDVIAGVYFNGFDNSTQKPGSILFAQYPAAAVAAYLRGGPINTLTIPQIQALTGSLTIVVDGYSRTNASFSLSSATSYSAAAALIQAAINTGLPTEASVTASIAAGTASATGSIAGNVLTVTAVASGTIVSGAALTGTGVTASTVIENQLSGTPGGIGTYAVNIVQNVASTALTTTHGVMTVTVVGSGTLSVGQTLSGAGVTVGTVLTQLGTGTGLTGTYYVSPTQTFASGAVTAKATGVAVTFDSITGGLIITSGITGAPSTIAYPTGTLADSLLLTSATGAVLSQGGDGQAPGTFMDAITAITQNWATFMTAFDPDGGSGNTQKYAFATWVNGTNKRYAYVCSDSDLSPTVTVPATTSLGHLLQLGNFSGTFLIYDPTPSEKAAFICGTTASIDFGATNGRINFKFRSQTGLIADVTNRTIYRNLIANGYNCYAAFATANQGFVFNADGGVSGPFQWMDTYVNQIWLNNQLQLALMELLVQVFSIPYNQAGYNLIRAAVQDPVNEALNFGAIRPGVTLSQAQAAEVNNSAGTKISDTLNQRGWYFQVLDPTPQVRQARGSPICNLWYMDGGSVNKITLNSVALQ